MSGYYHRTNPQRAQEAVEQARALEAALAEKGLKLQAFIDLVDQMNGNTDKAYLRRHRDAAIAIRIIAERGSLDAPMPLSASDGRKFSCGDTLALLQREGDKERATFNDHSVPARRLAQSPVIVLEDRLDPHQVKAARAMFQLHHWLEQGLAQALKDTANALQAPDHLPQSGRRADEMLPEKLKPMLEYKPHHGPSRYDQQPGSAEAVEKARHYRDDLKAQKLSLQDFIDKIDRLNAASDENFLRRHRDAARAILHIAEGGSLDAPMPLSLPNGHKFSCGDTLVMFRREAETERQRFMEKHAGDLMKTFTYAAEFGKGSQDIPEAVQAARDVFSWLGSGAVKHLENIAASVQEPERLPQAGRKFG